jgi:hypothetical protein
MATSTKRVLGLISAGAVVAVVAVVAMLAATAGLGRLLWDQFQGVEAPSGLLEWSVKAMAGGIVADIAARSWRRHPALAIIPLVVANVVYFLCRYLWLEAIAALNDPFAGSRWFALSFGGFVALAIAALSLESRNNGARAQG